MNRRKILGLFATAPVTSKLAAKELLEDSQLNLMGLDRSLTSTMNTGIPGVGAPGNGPKSESPEKLIQRAMKIPVLREKILEIALEDEFQVYSLDYDIANKRSFSLAAKVTFQRQRNRERFIKTLESGEQFGACSVS